MMKKRVLCLLLCFVFLMAFVVGCGSSSNKEANDEQASTGETASNDSSGSNSTSNDSSGNKDSSNTQNSSNDSNVKKKIIIVKEMDDDIRNKVQESTVSILNKNGFTNGSTADIIEIKMNNDEKKSSEVLEQIKKEKPDVVLMNATQFALNTVAKPLEGTGIPTVLYTAVEGYLDANGLPKQNVTGVKTMSSDLQQNAFSLLNEIWPLKGKKAAFCTLPGYFAKEGVQASLQAAGAELKEYVDTPTVEQFQKAITKFNKDDEIGWVLCGVWPVSREDGKAQTYDDLAKWYRDNNKKGEVSYWDISGRLGIVASLAIDLPECGNQAAELAVEILKGKDIKTIKAADPRKTNIILNKKRADDLKLTIPANILGSASTTFIDYQGNISK
ncbi:MAG: hypothetical protein N2645_18230 [Clostridia bacterium]|nr:hypothetical protein [Clostridia bacterium]